MENTRKLAKPNGRPNFIGAFEPTVLVEIEDANRMSQRGNPYTVFSTEDGGKVGIMDGELEDLHEKQGGILTDPAGKVLTAIKEGDQSKVSDKVKIGRGGDGFLYVERVA